MAFLNISLLLGGAFVAIPVVLHLIMRQKPRHLIFPALRFVKERREANSRRLNLRHWLLLALRCAALGLPVLALARPSVASAVWGNYLALGLIGLALMAAILFTIVALARKLSRYLILGLACVAVALGVALLIAGYRAAFSGKPVLGDQEAPVAAVLVIDTSPRMEYRHDNQRRLEVAQETAAWLIKQFPADSEVAIVDSRPGAAAFAIDRSAAEKSVQRLRPTGTPRPLADVLISALGLARQNPRPRKEVYVFSDLTAAAWKANQPGDVQKALSEHQEVQLYIIDVGVDKPRNFALGDLRLSSQILPEKGELIVETEVEASGLGGERTVEIVLEDPDPTLPIIRDGTPLFPPSRRRGIQTVQLEPGSGQKVKFNLRGLALSTHQGMVRLVGEDGLGIDDVRYFAVEVQPDWPVLVVSPHGVSVENQAYALEVRDPANKKPRSTCKVVEQNNLASVDFSSYRAVCLLDPAPLPADAWEKLLAFIERGGGVAIVLGHNAQPVTSFQEGAALKVLGGKLTRQTRSSGDLYLAPVSYDHSVLAEFRSIEANVPWDHFPVYYHWNLDELSSASRPIIAYGNNKPALVETRLGRGRVLVLTTPLTDPLRPRGRSPWNELWYGDDAWPAFVLWNEMVGYLVGASEVRLNYQAGDTAVLTNDPAIYPERYQLFTPLDEPQDVLARDDRVSVRFTDNPGAYRLRGQRGGPLVRGFAVNLPSDVGDLTRLPSEKLNELLGKDRFHFAQNKEEINRAVGNDRIGSEFYPLLIALLALALALEQTLANRFYRKDE